MRDLWPEWQIVFANLPDDMLGGTDASRKAVYIDPRQMQTQRRSSITHEMIHIEDGDDGCQGERREAEVDAEAARRLVPIESLLAAYVWAHSVDELAEECWVDVDTILCRLDNLHDHERLALRAALRQRDFHEEGWDIA